MAKVTNFFHTVFVKAIWQTFFVKWIWQTFCSAWVHDAFWKNLVVKKWKFDRWKGWVYLLPAIILLAVFTIYPIFNTVRIAFLDDYRNAGHNAGEVYTMGIENFRWVIKDTLYFLPALKNTMLLCFITVPISTFLALLIAVCLNAIKPLRRFLQTIFFLPYVTNSIAIGMVFMAMFNVTGHVSISMDNAQTLGVVNIFLQAIGIEPINWINAGSTYWSNMAVAIIYIVWNALPFKILILLGGLQSVNKQYYEAAKIDGTPRWRVFTRITVPLLSPMLAYVVITGFIGGFKEYSSIVGIFGDDMQSAGGNTLQTMVGYIQNSLDPMSGDGEGVASAAALILFAIIFVVTMINLYVSKKKTHY